jgi:hypothetical protein
MEVSGQLHSPAALPPRERTSGTPWVGGWVGTRAGLDEEVKRKIPSPAVTRTADHPARSPALYHLARLLFKKLIVTQLVKKYPLFMEPEGSLLFSQKPATGLYPEPTESSSPHRSLLPKVHPRNK